MNGVTTLIAVQENERGYVKIQKNEGSQIIGRGNCYTVWGKIDNVGSFQLGYTLDKEVEAIREFNNRITKLLN